MKNTTKILIKISKKSITTQSSSTKLKLNSQIQVLNTNMMQELIYW